MKKIIAKIGKKWIAFILAMTMVISVQGISVLSEAVTVKAVEREMPKNPVHHCEKGDSWRDTTDWSYVYFGSYPQTEVTGNALTAVITGASYDANGDAWVNGTKYRRMKKSDANYSSSSSGYFPWNGENDYHYFKWERIKWRVLNVNGSTMFVVADKGLDCKDYNEEYTSVTWENCTLRSWLNNDFYGTAFSSGEQGAVVAQTVVNEDNPDYNTEGGNDTTDKVYLLSLSEVMNPDYGFCEDYSTRSVSRRVKASDYAYARGAWVNAWVNADDYVGSCLWWLRSPGSGSSTNNAAFIRYDYVERYGYYVNYDRDACVPALHINLSSDLWSIADDGSSGEDGDDENSPKQLNFTYQSSDKDYVAKCYYTDDYFEKSSYTYNHSLATMSLCFAMSAFGSGRGGYENKSQNAQALLKNMGFDEEEIKVNEDFKVKPSTDSIGAIVGIKPIYVKDKAYTLVALAIRGSGYEQEWASNFTIGTSGQHAGFAKAKNDVINFLQEYLAEEKAKGKIPGDVKFWVTGFSRAAATANLVGAKLNDGINGVSYLGDDVYTYCFETPAGGLRGQTGRGVYDNIFNIINSNDPVPYVAPAAMGFCQYGKKLYLPSAETMSAKGYADRNKEMLKIYNSLASVKEQYAVDNFVLLQEALSMGVVQGTKKRKYSQGAFLSDFITKFSKETIVSRQNYSEEYQELIRNLFAARYVLSDQNPVNQSFLKQLEKNWFKMIYIASKLSWNRYGTVKEMQELLLKCLKEAAVENGIDYDEQEVEKEVDKELNNLAKLLVKVLVNHAGPLLTILVNISGIKGAHYPELCYAWMTSMDSNYVGGQDAKAAFTNGAYRIVRVNCAVDIEVMDENGNVVASIQNEEPQEIADSSIISSINEDGEKVIVLPPDQDYSICITGRADDKVNYAVNEYCASEGDYTRVINYFDIDLRKGESLEGEIPAYADSELETDTPEGSGADYTLYDSEHALLTKDSDIKGEEAENAYYKVMVETSDQQYGMVTGSGIRQYGSFAQVEASANEGCVFKGWYQGNRLVSNETVYRFSVVEDVTLVARFEKNSGSGNISDKENINLPKATTIKGKIKARSKAFLVKWKKQAEVSGYQIQYSTNKKFKKKGTKIKTVKKSTAAKLTVKKLKAGKKYYVRIRTYKTINGTNYYSAWSKSKSVKTKA